jgi:LPS export ABC transporter permease LptG/LPS export ABC transporter permease LptF
MTAEAPVHRRPGRTLYRYLVLEMVFPTLYTLGGLTLVVLVRELIGYSEMVINRGLSIGDVGQLAFFQMLPVVALMLPFSVLVGGLVALGRLGADRELLMLEASGVSSPRVLGPVMLFATAMSLVAFALSIETVPWAGYSLDRKLEEIGRRNPGAAITPGSAHRFGDWMLQAREVSPRGDHMRGVFLWMPSLGETVFAQSGSLEVGPSGANQVVLENGSLILDPRRTARELRFDRMTSELPSSNKRVSRSSRDKLSSLRLPELRQAALDATSSRNRVEAELELHRRFSLPAATLVFGLLIVPLFLARAHFSRSGGGVLGILATLAYYGLTQLGDSLVFDGTFPAVVGTWLPNILLGTVAGVMVARMTRMTAFGRHADRPTSREPKTKDSDPAKPIRLRARPWPLSRYVALRFLQMAGICFSVVLVGYLLIDVLERLQWMGKYGATLEQATSYYGARIPLLASRVVPMSLLVATALTVSLLAGQGELMGMRACGIPAPRALLPILVICGLIAPAYFVLNNEVLPETNALASYFKAVVKHKDKSSEGLGAWFRDGDFFFQADHLDPKQGTARNITVFQLGEDGLPISRGDARSARHIGGGQWLLEDSIRVERSESGLHRVAGPAHAQIGEAIQADVNTRHLSVGQLREEIEQVEASGLDATHYRVDLFVKLASPVACLVLPALALFFALGGPPHPSPATTLVLSAVVAVSYVLLTGVGTSFGYSGAIEPWIAGWGPTFFFSALAGYLGLRLRGFGQSFSGK